MTAVERQQLVKLESILHTKHRDPQFSVSDLSSEMGVSVRALQLFCRSLVGVTPIEIIRGARLAVAYNLIVKGHAAKTAALDAGFGEESDFSRYFRETFGISAQDLKRSVARLRG